MEDGQIWKFAETNKENTVSSVHCNKCGNTTNHSVLRGICYHDEEIIDEFCGYSWGGECQILSCMGCGEFSFREYSWFSEDPDESKENFFPPRLKVNPSQLYLREDVAQLPESIQEIYKEVLSAAQGNLTILAGFGIRAILESICKDKKTKGENLLQKIDNLEKSGLLTIEGAKILHGIRLLGNDAAHQMKGLAQSQVLVAMRVIDHLLLGVYVLPWEAEKAEFPQHSSKKTQSEKQTENFTDHTD